MLQKQIDDEAKVIPLKHVYRSQLIQNLKAAKIEEASAVSELG